MRVLTVIYFLVALLKKGGRNDFPTGEEVAGLFTPYRTGLAGFLQVLLLIIGAVTLGVATYHVLQGDREAAKKYFVWIVVMALGFILLNIISSLSL